MMNGWWILAQQEPPKPSMQTIGLGLLGFGVVSLLIGIQMIRSRTYTHWSGQSAHGIVPILGGATLVLLGLLGLAGGGLVLVAPVR
jgi:hypothetical protein